MAMMSFRWEGAVIRQTEIVHGQESRSRNQFVAGAMRRRICFPDSKTTDSSHQTGAWNWQN